MCAEEMMHNVLALFFFFFKAFLAENLEWPSGYAKEKVCSQLIDFLCTFLTKTGESGICVIICA